MDEADDIGPFFGKAGGFGELKESGRHLRPAMKSCFQAGGGIAALTVVFRAGGEAAFFAGETGPVREHGSRIDAKAAGIRRKTCCANRLTIATRKMRNEPAVMNTAQTHEFGASRGALELAGCGTEGREDLRAGEHGGEYHEEKENTMASRKENCALQFRFITTSSIMKLETSSFGSGSL